MECTTECSDVVSAWVKCAASASYSAQCDRAPMMSIDLTFVEPMVYQDG